MSRKRIEKRLSDIGERLRDLRVEAATEAAQLVQVATEADDARVQALVAESPLARHDHRDAQASADTLVKRHQRVLAKIADLESRQDELLDELTALNG